jgi:hypothetical protein
MSNKVFPIQSRIATIQMALLKMGQKLANSFETALKKGQNDFEFWCVCEVVTFKEITTEVPIRYFEAETDAMLYTILWKRKNKNSPVKYSKVKVTIPTE